MFKGVSYLKLNQILLALTAFVLFIAFRYSLLPTWRVYDELQRLESQTESGKAGNYSGMNNSYAEKEKNNLIREFSQSGARTILLDSISAFTGRTGILLKEMPEPRMISDTGFLVQQNNFLIEGRFSDLLQLLYLLEYKMNIGKISSVRFYTPSTSEEKGSLLANITIQNMIHETTH